MKKDLYKTMYGHIQLNEKQKKTILQELIQGQKMPKKSKRFPAYAAACLCILLLSNVMVYAAVQLHLGDMIADEMNHFFGSKRNLTQEQKAVYEDQSIGLGQKIPLSQGTLIFESMLCDNSYLYIPYTFYSNNEEKSLTARSLVDSLVFVAKGDETDVISKITYTEPKPREDNKIHGSFMITGYSFHQGDTIQVYRQDPEDSLNPNITNEAALQKTENSPGLLLCELPVTKMVSIKNIPFDDQEIRENLKTQIEKIVLSPLSVQINGKYEKEARDRINQIEIELKDGTIVKRAPSGSGSRSWDDEDNVRNFEICMIFKSPAALDNIKKIHLLTRDGSEYCIPVQTSVR